MAIQLISEITPKNSGSFALLDDEYLRGGLRVKETFEELADIPADRLKDGCLAVIKSPIKQIYTYNATDNEWTVFSSGGGDGGATIYDDVTSEIYTWSSQKIASELEERLSLDDVDNVISPTSKKPVQNKVIAEALEEKISKDDVDSAISPYSKNPVQNKVIAEALENVKAGKTMTAEEYDSLDDETKNDGSFYYISDTGEIYQNGIIYGGKQIFDVTQEEYDALTDEEKADNEYRCTDTGRIYINGILYGDKKPIELTFEEYKQLEADGLVEEDVDYVIVSDEKGILLTNIDLEHGTSGVTCYEVIETLKSDVEGITEEVETFKEDIATELKTNSNTDVIKTPDLKDTTYFDYGNDTVHNYVVRNGICYFTILLLEKTHTTSFVTIMEGLPGALMQTYFSFPPYYSASGDNTSLQVNFSSDGVVAVSMGAKDNTYMLTGSYPIA